MSSPDATPPDASSDASPSEREPSGGLGEWSEALRDVAPYLDLGWRVAVATALPPGVGFAVDVWLGVSPWGVAAGAALGLAGAVVQIARLGPEMEKRAAASGRNDDAAPRSAPPSSETDTR
jgi:hypothetical protein